jgi:hypothetical protein
MAQPLKLAATYACPKYTLSLRRRPHASNVL